MVGVRLWSVAEVVTCGLVGCPRLIPRVGACGRLVTGDALIAECTRQWIFLIKEVKTENEIRYSLRRDIHHVKCCKGPRPGIDKIDERS